MVYMLKNKFSVLTLNRASITDFSEERNKMLQKAGNSWVLFLDTDEKIDEKLETEINNKIESKNFIGFYLLRNNYFLGKFIGQDKLLRLGIANKGKWTRSVHETWQIKGRVGELKNPITHTTATNLFEYVNKLNLYSSMHARENLKEGKKPAAFKIVLYPLLQFSKSLISGRGIVFSIFQSFHSFLGWSEMYLNVKNENN